jgi:LPS export ABC transporter protein LptC
MDRRNGKNQIKTDTSRMTNHVGINPLKSMAIALIAIVMPFYFLASCGDEKKEMVEIVFDPQISYTLKETNVKTFISSDSGITRVIAATWLIFDKASEPYWYFPDSIYLEKFDTAFNLEISIKADTAHYFLRRSLWQLDGNIDISNTDGVRFETSQLFWDQDKRTVYSDSFIKITEGEDIHTGIGFQSNETMSEYEIFNSTADFSVEMQRRTNESKSDSVLIEKEGIINEEQTITTNEERKP